MYEPSAVFCAVQSFQNRKNIDWWRSLKWTTFHVNRRGFLWLASCNSLQICSTWSDSKQGVLRSSSEAFEWSRTLKEASVVDEPELGVAPRQCTSSIVVPCAQFSGKKTKRPLYPSHPTLQIWLQRTSFCFLSWSLPWMDAVSTHLTRFWKIRRRSSPFRKKHFRKHSKVGRNVGSGVLLTKETTLKATNSNKVYLSTYSFYYNSPVFYWSYLVFWGYGPMYSGS